MKKLFALLLAMLMLAGILAGCGSNPQAAANDDETPDGVQHVVYGFPGTAARLNFVNDDGSYGGYEIDIVRELDARLDDVEFELYCTGEFSALTPGLDAGKFGMVGSNITWKQERADNYLYSTVAYLHTPYVMAVRTDETEINSLDDLGGHKMVAIPGTAGTLWLEAYNEAHPENPIQIEYIESTAIDTIAMLVEGRTDVTFCNVSDYAIAEEERGYKVKFVDIDVSEVSQQPDGFFLFPKGAEELQQKVDACLNEMRADGTLSKLCLKYFTMDFSQLDADYTQYND